jgi:DNA-binding MarR family transcriptional regulator
MTSSKLSASEYRALAALRYQVRLFLAFREQVARDKGLEPQQYQMMLAIKGAAQGTEVTISMLAERMLVRHNTAVEMTNRLAERGMVIRKRHPLDRRKALVCLSAKGEGTLYALALASREELQLSGPALVRALRRMLNDSSTKFKNRGT